MINHIHIRDFCSIQNWQSPVARYTSIIGPNGSGKTHILEAIHILAGSEPIYQNPHIIGGTFFETQFENNGLIGTYRLYNDGTKDTWSIQSKTITKKKYRESLPFRTVFMSPFDMNLLYFAPSFRRDYIDNILARTHEQFRETKKDYENIMRQRNALLKKIRDGETGEEDLVFWDKKFAEKASLYRSYRKLYTNFLHENASILNTFLQKYDITSRYEIREDEHIDGIVPEDPDSIELILRQNRKKDIITGHTHLGPHRDDIAFLIQKKDSESEKVENYLSRGEMKMLVLALKILEVEFLKKYKNLPVILLIDDIFAELDEKNMIHFLNSLTTYQVILTSQKPLPHGVNWEEFICINLQDM